jgi:hypothetical protein
MSNAARRVHDILKKAIDDGQDQEPIYVVLARSLGLDHPDQNKYFLTDFFVLLSDAQRIVEQLKNVDNLETYVGSIKEIQTLLFTYGSYQGKWESMKSTIINRNLLGLIHASSLFIKNERIDVDLTEEQLHEYLEQCESLLQEVVASDLAKEIKTYLVVRLEEICSAIRHYKLGGPERLKIVVDAGIGAVFVRYNKCTEQQKEGVISKILNILGPIATVIGLAADTTGFVLPAAKEAVKYILPSAK